MSELEMLEKEAYLAALMGETEVVKRLFGEIKAKGGDWLKVFENMLNLLAVGVELGYLKPDALPFNAMSVIDFAPDDEEKDRAVDWFANLSEILSQRSSLQP